MTVGSSRSKQHKPRGRSEIKGLWRGGGGGAHFHLTLQGTHTTQCTNIEYEIVPIYHAENAQHG